MGAVIVAVALGRGGVGDAVAGPVTADSECAAEAQSDLDLSDEQMRNAAIIAEVGVDMDMPERAVVVALATAFQESNMKNVDYGDRDSLGLFQQRPSQGWGTPRQVRDPEYAAGKFYAKLRTIDGWERMRVTQAAQAVQISAYPEAYDKHVGKAERLADALLDC